MFLCVCNSRLEYSVVSFATENALERRRCSVLISVHSMRRQSELTYQSYIEV
jgi:hypothetical protein